MSLKADFSRSPWDVAEEKYPEGSIVEGKVVRITTFGAFVELEPGLDGLVHISQCALKRIAKVEDAVQVGQTVRVKVLGGGSGGQAHQPVHPRGTDRGS